MSKWKADSKLTMTKGVGTPAFMAPEVLSGKPVQYKSDMYSIGVTLYYLMAKETPNMLDDVVPEQFEIDRSFYSREIIEICGWLLKKNAADRPVTQDLIERLLEHPIIQTNPVKLEPQILQLKQASQKIEQK